jgi:hypothetical protein
LKGTTIGRKDAEDNISACHLHLTISQFLFLTSPLHRLPPSIADVNCSLQPRTAEQDEDAEEEEVGQKKKDTKEADGVELMELWGVLAVLEAQDNSKQRTLHLEENDFKQRTDAILTLAMTGGLNGSLRRRGVKRRRNPISSPPLSLCV